jgi:hypothetical protein
MLSACLLPRDKDFVAYVDLRHFRSGSGADETSGSVRGCGSVELVGKASRSRWRENIKEKMTMIRAVNNAVA